MNEQLLRNQLPGDLSTLIEDLKRFLEYAEINPYSKNNENTLHEYNTRIFFFDRLLEILGWRLGASGNVAEEAGIKADTTRFIDYVGLNQDTKAPLIIFEAKAWDVPFVSAHKFEEKTKGEDLIAATIRHMLNNRSEEEPPVSKQWHDYLKQVLDYVHTMEMKNEYDTPYAVLSSGQWTIAFTNPVLTFVDGKINPNNIKVFKLGSYVTHADTLFSFLRCSIVAKEIPFPLLPALIKDYVGIDKISHAFYGVHGHYKETGSRFLGPKPQVLIYPVLVLQRNDGIFSTVVNKGESFILEYENNDGVDSENLTIHLNAVTSCLQELHRICEDELDRKLTISSIEKFSEFSFEPYDMNNTPLVVKRIKNYHDEWLLVTGTENHYLQNIPLIEQCRLHSSSEYRSEHCKNGMLGG